VQISQRTFVSYIDKSREFYAAQGYAQPYRWASHSETPFTPLAKPLDECRVAVITTAALEPTGLLRPFFASTASPPGEMETDHLSWHKDATTTDDLGAFLPIDHLKLLAAEGLIGDVAPRFAGIPTVYSRRRTEKWAHDVHQGFVEDHVDLVLLAPL
jgi:hypothetical protein